MSSSFIVGGELRLSDHSLACECPLHATIPLGAGASSGSQAICAMYAGCLFSPWRIAVCLGTPPVSVAGGACLGWP